jgi:hypothetical protein
MPPPQHEEPPPGPDETRAAQSTADRLCAVVEASFAAADAGRSCLPPAALEMEGMSGTKTRHLYSNLCCMAAKAVARCRCLQVGVWKGSTVIAALAGSEAAGGGATVTAVDDWSEFRGGGDPKAAFEAASRQLLTDEERGRLAVAEGDAFGELAPPLGEGAYGVYVYDGAHDYESQVGWAWVLGCGFPQGV